ncbi:MAG: hypothetical protein ABR612_11290 [Chromatocurvus sp.]
MPVTQGTPLRNAAALLTGISGSAQVSLLWVLELGAPVLGVAFAGCVYLMLALGLFGVSRFALFAAVVVPALRAFYAWNPLPVLVWEQLRTIGDLIIAVIALFLLWQARHRPTH